MDSLTLVNTLVAIAAVYGAILSTFVFVRQFRRDRPSLFLRITEEYYRASEDEEAELEALIVEVVNKGQQALPVSFVGFVQKGIFRKRTFYLPRRANRHSGSLTLEPGQSIDYRFKAMELATDFINEGRSSPVHVRAYALTAERQRFESESIEFFQENVHVQD